MEKEGWVKKKLGEVLTVERGGSPRPINAFLTDSEDGLNWIKIGDTVEGSRYISHTKEKIKPEGLKKSRFVHKGDFILSNSMSFGKPYILNIEGCIHDGWLVLHDDYNTFDKNYLYYFLSSPCVYKEFQRMAVGGVVNNLNSALVRSLPIIYPPLPEQQQIVSELDCLQGIIDKKKEQLQELDKLAQSIFYTMFGDPVENEKGWDTKKLKDVSPKKDYKEDIPSIDGKYWLLNLDMVESNTGKVISKVLFDYEEIGNSTNKFNTENILYSKLRPYLNKVVIPEDIGYSTSELVPLYPQKDILNRYFLAFLLRSKSFVHYISDKVAGAKMPRVNMDSFYKFYVILPPLPLQQEFADKISAIEQQKARITQSLQDTETLFQSRMDYYFG